MRNLVFLTIVVAAVCLSGPAGAQKEVAGTTDTAPVVGSSEQVKRAVFTSAILEREPADKLDTVTIPAETVFFFTEIVGLAGKTITHRWMFAGEEKAAVSFDIGGPRWRVYSSKKLKTEWVGEWVVEVVDTDGNILHKASFEYKEAE